MAKRTLRPQHQDDIRAKIQGVQLAKMLAETALTGSYNGVEVNPVRIQAAVALLRKVVPDLASTDVTLQSKESWSESLQRIADARKEVATNATVTPITAPTSTKDAA